MKHRWYCTALKLILALFYSFGSVWWRVIGRKLEVLKQRSVLFIYCAICMYICIILNYRGICCVLYL